MATPTAEPAGLAGLSTRDPAGLGPYRLLGVLGAGAMGRVYLGRDAGGRLAAVKMMHTRYADDPGFRQRFAQEVALARRVRSPWVADILDADPVAPLPWLAMRYTAGPSLEAAVAHAGALPTDTLAVLGAGLARACTALHAAEVVHRDVKPSNVLLAEDGPRLIDFGIARALAATTLTRTGAWLGPPAFMSPEQALGQPAGFASDVFSLAAVLVYAATGEGPFGQATNPVVLMRRVVDDPPVLDGVPDRLCALLRRCLEKDPKLRPTATELAQQLAPHASSATSWPPPVVAALRPSIPSDLPPPADPRPSVARRSVLIGLGIAGGAALVAPYVRRHGAGPPASRPGWDSLWSYEGRDGWLAAHPIESGLCVVSDSAIVALSLEADPAIAFVPGARKWPLVRWRTELGHLATTPDHVSLCRGHGSLFLGVRDQLSAFDELTGTERWRADAATLGLPSSGGREPMGIATGNGVVSVGIGGHLAALEPATGRLRWVRRLGPDARCAVQGVGSSCLAVADASLHAHDVVSGEQLWRSRVATATGDGAQLAVGDERVLVLGAAGISAFDLGSGAQLWQCALVPGPPEPVAEPSSPRWYPVRLWGVGARIVVLAADGRVHGLDPRTGVEAWAYPTVRDPGMDQIALDEGRVFLHSRIPVGHDEHRIQRLALVDGTPRLAAQRDDPSGIVAADAGILYLGSRFGAITAVRL